MVEMCCDPEGVEGLDEGSMEKWSKLRKYFIEKTRDLGWGAQEQFQLPDGYFDDLPDHGPLLLQPSPQPPSPGHLDVESEVETSASTTSELKSSSHTTARASIHDSGL